MNTPLHGLGAGAIIRTRDFSETEQIGFYKQGKGVNQDVSGLLAPGGHRRSLPAGFGGFGALLKSRKKAYVQLH